MTNTKIIDCTTCKYGYEDERLGIPMCHHPKRFSEDCVDSDFRMYEEKETKEPEKPIGGLEEELERFIASGKSVTVDDCGTYKVSYHDFKKVARHFAEWQKEQIIREMIMSDGSYFQKCYELGKKDMKEQMMKDAVKGEVSAVILRENRDEVHYAVTYPEGESPHSITDKVHIIIVKED